MPCNNAIAESSDRRVTRKMPVTPQGQPAPRSGSIAEHPANGFSASIDIAVWFNQADSRLKTFYGNVANKACSLGLERSDINLATDRLLPAADPAKAKVTFSVVDQKRPFGGRGTVNEAIGTLN